MKKITFFFGLMLAMLASSMPAQAVKVYFNNPLGWTQVCAYVYTDGSDNSWPGTAMTKDNTTGLWSMDLPAAMASDCRVIFNNNNAGQQYPSADGLEVKGKDMICLADGYVGDTSISSAIWNEYQSAPFSVYFDNSIEKWATPKVHYWGAAESTWPGVAMTAVTGENNVWTATIPAGVGAVIFTNGANNNTLQSKTYAVTPNHKYNKSSDLGVFQAAGPAPEPFYIYFDNAKAGWITPYIHYWGAAESTWPGVAMTKDSGNIWKYQVPGGTTGCLFNAGDGDASKTGNFNAVANHVYTQTKDEGLRSEYNPTVEMPSALYILGSVGADAWATTPGVAMTKEGNTYKATNVVINPEDKTAATLLGGFSFVTKVGANWDVVNQGDRYGATIDNLTLTSGTPAAVALYAANVSASASKAYKIAPGKYDIVVDFAAMQVTATLVQEELKSGALIVPTVTIERGKTGNLEVLLNTEAPMMDANFEVAFPAGVTPGTPVLDPMYTHHQLSSSVVDGKLCIAIVGDNSLFERTSGRIVTIPVTVASAAALGELTVTIDPINFTDESYRLVTNAAVTGKIKVVDVAATEVTLNKTSIALQVGETETLVATVLPEDAADKTVVWTSESTAIATVDQTGKVTAVAKGTTTIYARVGDLTATCLVSVGKSGQTITWDQELATMAVGDADITLTATASSGLAVTYVVTAGQGLVTITGNTLHVVAPGLVTIQAQQTGNDVYAPAEPISKSFKIKADYIDGDVNGDKVINVTDVTAAISYILHGNPEPFNTAAADMDADGQVTIADVSLIKKAVLEQEAQNASPVRQLLSIDNNLESFMIEGDEQTLRVSFTNMEQYIATQFDVYMPFGCEVVRGSLVATNHDVEFFNAANGRTRVLVTSRTNEPFAVNDYISLRINQPINGEVTLSNALINAMNDGTPIEYAANGATATVTGIEGVAVDAAAPAEYYNLQGVRVANPEAGQIYIVRKGGKVEKTIVR